MGKQVTESLKSRCAAARKAAYGLRGLVTREHLKAAGISKFGISNLVSASELAPVLPRVWRFRNVLLPEPAKFLAATLAYPGCVFSHATAARLHGLDTLNGPTEVTRPKRTHSQDGLRFHQARIGETERLTIDGVPVTTLQRTLFDLAAGSPLEELALAVESAWRQDRLNPVKWLARLKRANRTDPSQWPAPALRRVLRDCQRRGRPLDSALEVLFLYRGRERDLPEPQVHMNWVDDYGQPLAPDFSWPQRRVIVETLGFEVHGTQDAFEADCMRVLRLAAGGWTVIPVTWRMLTQEGDTVFDLVKKALEAHPLRRWGKIVVDSYELPVGVLPPG